MKQGGSYANSSGKVLEGLVEFTLTKKGFTVIRYKDWKLNPSNYGGELLLKNVPYEGIYKHASSTEFVLISKAYNLNTRIECKWQQVSGSADEKLPYLFLNCSEKMVEPHIIILLDGGGSKTGAIGWLREACEKFNLSQSNASKRRIDLMDMTDFVRWANTVFK
ncbi:4-diphosphocytidyl-2-methyl-D-erythritol synthase [Legionella rubrilucens]|uniref:4-diphosphocytidyl-2-methyl-D-erythritol synthase n=1 Tax=Legionella rubrilucens TaxID=458 RepID=A0A0W0XV29_9GAMM|nr:PD-(D/E)XK nuclease superfamily protein [Legionella rubrilucens]KTD48377.1 4-diphosphocytidyl-2-methyl-D-erythritol synthase [Legionella rubrilucens]